MALMRESFDQNGGKVQSLPTLNGVIYHLTEDLACV